MTAGLRWTPEQLQAHQGRGTKVARSKYGNKKVTHDGVQFDSVRELRRYQDLVLQQEAGQIFDLKRQVPFDITINGIHVCTYVADFVFRRQGKTVVADAKGMRTREYITKRKLMMAVHGVEIEEL